MSNYYASYGLQPGQTQACKLRCSFYYMHSGP